jgi:hypothetical protein
MNGIHSQRFDLVVREEQARVRLLEHTVKVGAIVAQPFDRQGYSSLYMRQEVRLHLVARPYFECQERRVRFLKHDVFTRDVHHYERGSSAWLGAT